VNGTLFFNARDGSSGHELWKSDGTAAGTVLVKDINPGSGGSDPRNLTAVNGMLFFRADDDSSGYELWKSDGTAAGTVMVKDINPRYLTVMNGTLFFTADDGGSGRELWKSDGTEAGTVRVKDINPGSDPSDPVGLIAVNDVLFFSADDGSNGRELWKSYGTEAGTVLVKDICPGGGSAFEYNSYLTVMNGTLFFSANDGTVGAELWALDVRLPDLGLSKAVDPVTPITPGSPITYTLTFANVGYTTTTNIVITDIVPITLTNVSVISSGVVITDTGYSPGYVWQVQDLAAGQRGVITITGEISPSVGGTFTLTNQATITATDVYTDADSHNNVSAARCIVDAEPPVVVAVSPDDGAVNVAHTAPVVITFSEVIDTDTFAYTITPDPGAGSALWGAGDTVVTVTDAPFVGLVTYTFTVTAAADLAGNPLAGVPYTWHFTTAFYQLYLPLVVRDY
jgi:uncharacterized repeat protein (TIGR01451 family)